MQKSMDVPGDIFAAMRFPQFAQQWENLLIHYANLVCMIVTLVFTLTRTLNRIRVKILVGNSGIFDTKCAFGVNKSFKNTIYSGFLEFKSRLAHQKKSRYLFQIPGFFFAFVTLLHLKNSIFQMLLLRVPLWLPLFGKNSNPSFLGVRNRKTKS